MPYHMMPVEDRLDRLEAEQDRFFGRLQTLETRPDPKRRELSYDDRVEIESRNRHRTIRIALVLAALVIWRLWG